MRRTVESAARDATRTAALLGPVGRRMGREGLYRRVHARRAGEARGVARCGCPPSRRFRQVDRRPGTTGQASRGRHGRDARNDFHGFAGVVASPFGHDRQRRCEPCGRHSSHDGGVERPSAATLCRSHRGFRNAHGRDPHSDAVRRVRRHAEYRLQDFGGIHRQCAQSSACKG